MVFRNFCIVALGNTTGIKEIIDKINESKLKSINQKNVFIATFATNLTIDTLKSIIGKDKTFFIFEVDESKNAFNLGKEEIHNDLFGDILNNTLDLQLRFDTWTESSISESIDVEPKIKILDNDELIKRMSNDEIETKIEELINKGYGTLTDNEKDLLKKLSNPH